MLSLSDWTSNSAQKIIKIRETIWSTGSKHSFNSRILWPSSCRRNTFVHMLTVFFRSRNIASVQKNLISSFSSFAIFLFIFSCCFLTFKLVQSQRKIKELLHLPLAETPHSSNRGGLSSRDIPLSHWPLEGMQKGNFFPTAREACGNQAFPPRARKAVSPRWSNYNCTVQSHLTWAPAKFRESANRANLSAPFFPFFEFPCKNLPDSIV